MYLYTTFTSTAVASASLGAMCALQKHNNGTGGGCARCADSAVRLREAEARLTTQATELADVRSALQVGALAMDKYLMLLGAC